MTEAWQIVRRILAIAAAVAAASLGFPQLGAYLLLNNLVYAVLVSMIVDSWQRGGGVLIESNAEKWIVYVHGIPVRESRSTLRNLLFESTHMMRRRYLGLLAPKLVLSLICACSVLTTIPTSRKGVDLVFAVGTLLVLLYAAYRTSRWMWVAYSDSWLTAACDVDSKTLHAAYLPKGKDDCVPFLGSVFK